MTTTTPTPTGISLTTSYFWLAFLLTFFKPQVSIDGAQPVRVPWGDSYFPAAPGQHRVNVWFNYLFFGACGRAELMVFVPPAGLLPVRYKAPTWFVFSPGTLVVEGAESGSFVSGPAAGVPQPVQPMAQQAAAPPPGPQWDAPRNAWVQYDPAQRRWLKFDDATQQWMPLT
jgi:hypothetical protein